MQDIVKLGATEQVSLVKRREVSAEELLKAHLSRIEQVNPAVNALVTLVPELAIAAAQSIDQRLARNEDVGTLCGLPVAHKDLHETRGIRTTWGSPLYRDHIPDSDHLVVQRMRSAGAVTVGKTNTPEWGAGSQTFNTLFGATGNPYDLSKTCGGSSGGAAAALAARMLPLCDGSDLGGSLRNPASFCNVVGFRVSPGRVPFALPRAWDTLPIAGPMARNVTDCALFLSAIAGPHPCSPLSINEDPRQFRESLDADFDDVRIAISPDFGGQIPVETAVRDIVASSASVFKTIGCDVEEQTPDFSDAAGAFDVLRAWSFAARHGERVKAQPGAFKDTVIWNTEQGLKLTAADVHRAETMQTSYYLRLMEFFSEFSFLILPVAQVLPFDIETEYVTEINGIRMDSYIEWMRACTVISVSGLPAISMPCGFSDTGLPVGIQIVGKPQADLSVLRLAYAFEQANPVWQTEPDF